MVTGMAAPGIEAEKMPTRILQASACGPYCGIPTAGTSRRVVSSLASLLTLFMRLGEELKDGGLTSRA